MARFLGDDRGPKGVARLESVNDLFPEGGDMADKLAVGRPYAASVRKGISPWSKPSRMDCP